MPGDDKGRDLKDLLPDEARRRIIAEEEFRRAVARQVERDSVSRRERFFRSLNTPIVIWALSTILVGLISALYQQHSASQQKQQESRARLSRNTTELRYRLSARDRIDSLSTRDDVENLLTSVMGYRPFYPEYRSRRLDEIYLEYCSLTHREPIPKDTLTALASSIRLTTWPVIVGQPIDKPLKDRSILPALKAMCSRLDPLVQDVRATQRGTADSSRTSRSTSGGG